MRIGIVTQWFPPEPGTVVAFAMAEGLASRGHDVHVLTGFPNYPTGTLHEDYPLRPYRRERMGSFTVHRAPLYPSHDQSAVRRVVNYASFAVAATAVAWSRLPRPDVWLVYSSPATAAIPAMLSRWSRNVPACLVIQDLWPDSVTQSGFVGGRLVTAIERVLDRYCSWTYRRASGIGVISPSMRKILVERGVSDDKIHDTPNWVDDSHVASGADPDGRVALGLPQGRLFMYAGNVGELQGLEPLVKAFVQIPEAQLVVVGDGVARRRLQSLAEESGAGNVRFLGHVPSERVGAFIRASDVQIVSLQDTPLLRATMPSKVQSSLAFGKPVLAHAAGDVAALIDRQHAGTVAPPGDLEGTVSAIHSLASVPDRDLAVMGSNARTLFEDQFSAGAGLDRLETMLMTSLESGRTR